MDGDILRHFRTSVSALEIVLNLVHTEMKRHLVGPTVLEFAESYACQLTPGWPGEELHSGGWSVTDLEAD